MISNALSNVLDKVFFMLSSFILMMFKLLDTICKIYFLLRLSKYTFTDPTLAYAIKYFCQNKKFSGWEKDDSRIGSG